MAVSSVSFFGVRRLILADVPPNSEDLMQRVGRAVRFMGHSALPPEQRRVEVRLYVATPSRSGASADEVMIERLREDLGTYAPELAELKSRAVDAGMWFEEEEPAGGGDAAGPPGENISLGKRIAALHREKRAAAAEEKGKKGGIKEQKKKERNRRSIRAGRRRPENKEGEREEEG